MMEDWRNGGFGLYLHWPFCASKCPYCDFNSHVAAEIDINRWNRAYLTEIERVAADTEGRILNSVFFGGGTPSLMPAELVASILDKVRDSWRTANDLEITLEANPTSVEAGRFRGYAAAGVNRLSMGVQALNDADLKRLGRLHSVAEAERAFATAREIFDRVSFDLIYARQDQTLSQWEAELTRALSMAVDHFSLYQLTIEDGTAFGARHAAGGLRGLPGEDLAADMYLITQEICEAAGLPAYEVSNHAMSPEHQSVHNMIYWQGGDWIGAGPGAHGRVTVGGHRYAYEAQLRPEVYMANMQALGSGWGDAHRLDATAIAQELLAMGLRPASGIDIARIEAVAGKPVSREKIAVFAEQGWVTFDRGILSLTPSGRLLADALTAQLAP